MAKDTFNLTQKQGKRKKKKSARPSTSKFSIIESYKTLRTNIQFTLNKDQSNVILITSTLPKDGKSTVTANLGVAFSQTDSKVLIVDCDMRKPRINKFFNVTPTPGLSDCIAGLSNFDEVVQKTKHENLFVVTSGTMPPNPAELLAAVGMHTFIEKAKETFDLIILDGPPLNIVSDSYVVSKLTDGVLLVIRHESTTYPMVEKCLKGLKLAKANIIGTVMNAVDYEKLYGKRYGYYYKYDYGYSKYGYGYSNGTDEDEKSIFTEKSLKEEQKKQLNND